MFYACDGFLPLLVTASTKLSKIVMDGKYLGALFKVIICLANYHCYARTTNQSFQLAILVIYKIVMKRFKNLIGGCNNYEKWFSLSFLILLISF